MNKLITLSLAFCAFNSFSQSYAPPANNAGTTAIYKDSSVFVAWATGVEIKRGFLNAADTNFTAGGTNKASFGSPAEALHQAEGSSAAIVSLGDGGTATLTFEKAIINGTGPDFAVFENSFLPDFLELAFVEVSSDGINFFRFPAITEVQFATQIDSYGPMDCRYINNFAGKYEQGFGTPFDLGDLPEDPLLNVNAVTHVRIIDVIGTIDPDIAMHDDLGNIVNDPFPTAFASGGFDLDGVGVIHQQVLGLNETEISVQLYPNPTSGILNISLERSMDLQVLDMTGKVLLSFKGIQNEKLDLSGFGNGLYLLEFSGLTGKAVKKVIVK